MMGGMIRNSIRIARRRMDLMDLRTVRPRAGNLMALLVTASRPRVLLRAGAGAAARRRRARRAADADADPFCRLLLPNASAPLKARAATTSSGIRRTAFASSHKRGWTF